jgi:hypothetical protein
MPDLVSRKKHEKKVLDRWENEGGQLSADEKNRPRAIRRRSGNEKKRSPKTVDGRRFSVESGAPRYFK